MVGLRTEAEHVRGVQTVLVARPTLDGFLCKRTIGCGARLVAPLLGKTRFLVSDSVDDLDPCGVSPARRSAAIDIGSDSDVVGED